MKTKTSSKRNRSRDRKRVNKPDGEKRRHGDEEPSTVATCESDGAQRSPKGETSVGRERIKRETVSGGDEETMTVEDREAMLAFLGREEAAEDFEKVDPVRFNHAVLVFIRCVIDALRLRPFQVEAQTGVKHQHLHKMRPHEGEVPEVHITLCTLASFCNGLHIRMKAALDWIMRHLLLTLLPLLEPLEA